MAKQKPAGPSDRLAEAPKRAGRRKKASPGGAPAIDLEEVLADRFVSHFLSATTDVVFIYDLVERQYVYSNHEITSCLGYTPEELRRMGTTAVERLVHPEDAGRVQAHFEECSRTADGDILEIEYRMKHAYGEWHWLSSRDTVCNRAADGKAARILGVAEDVTEKRRVQEKMWYMSTHDALTGLYNRAYYEEELLRLERGRRFPVTVLAADVDGLREVNETRGHAAGDALIRNVAEIIKSCFRAEDVVARIGGDEFAVLLPDIGAASTETVLVRINRRLEAFNQAHTSTPVRLSIGVATAERGSSLQEAVREADRRMYVKKAALGGGGQ